MKTCSTCGIEKKVTEFYKASRARDGLQSQCKPCNTASMHKWRNAHTIKNMFTCVKSRAKKSGITFDITVEDIYIPDTCPILGMPLVRGGGSGPGARKNSPSLDRIDPEKGYVPGNIQVISNMANTMKHNATPEELLMFADWVYKTYGGNK